MNSSTNLQAKRHIGQILVDQGILTEDQLRIALLEQMKSHPSISTSLDVKMVQVHIVHPGVQPGVAGPVSP